ncbi:MAG: thiamine pyrophosphate-dependent enzyme [Desulfomonilaceae bacterium]
MTVVTKMKQHNNLEKFLLGNEALARGALEAGISFAAGYPGTPSSEIIETLAKSAKELNLYVEWSTNEKVAVEGAAAAAIAGLRTLVAMKNAGLSVALDFLTHLSLTGLGDRHGAMVAVVCDDPDAHSSGDETDSRWLAKFASAPLMEPSTVQEAHQMIQAAYELSEKRQCYVMLRSYTRLSHASSVVKMGVVPPSLRKAYTDPSSCLTPYLAKPKHDAVLEKLQQIEKEFDASPFNEYLGPKRSKLVIVCSGSGVTSATEAIELLGLEKSIGILKLGTLWPFPKSFVQQHLKNIGEILVVEEVDPFLEFHIKEALYEVKTENQTVYGKLSAHIPSHGEIDPDRIVQALCAILKMDYQARTSEYSQAAQSAVDDLLVSRGLSWCPGCPHRGSFWALGKALKGDKRDVYVTGDIGCYTLDVFPEGKCQMNLLHAMGSGVGLAAGLGQLSKFGYDQPVISICGDSTFFHAALPGLINAIYNKSNMVFVILDNQATAMTGFQAHPGVGYNAMGEPANRIDIETLCRALGASVTVSDAFDIKGTTAKIRELLKVNAGVRILILRRVCELLRMKREKKKPLLVKVDAQKCKGEKCAICYSSFRCPAFIQDAGTGKASIREDACPGCGVCISICPSKAITQEVPES